METRIPQDLHLMFHQQRGVIMIEFIIVYAVDGGMTILHRAFLGENLMMPHKKHVYQLMANELGMSHLKVSLIYMGLQALCNIWLIANPGNTTLFLQLIVLSMLYMVFMRKYYHLHVE